MPWEGTHRSASGRIVTGGPPPDTLAPRRSGPHIEDDRLIVNSRTRAFRTYEEALVTNVCHGEWSLCARTCPPHGSSALPLHSGLKWPGAFVPPIYLALCTALACWPNL